MKVQKCEVCGKEFEAGTHYQIYCSEACKHRAYYLKTKAARAEISLLKRTKVCPVCHQRFVARKRAHNQICCSAECAAAWTAERERKYYQRNRAKIMSYTAQQKVKKKAEKAEAERKEVKRDTLLEKELAARELGMSYGKYCLYLEAQKGAE